VSEHPDRTLADLADWLTELRHQQKSRDSRITEVELYRSWDRWLDQVLALAAREGRAMSNDDHPAAVGHVPLSRTGEIVTVQCRDDASVVVALYAPPGQDTGSGDDTVTPAPVLLLDPAEAEVLGSLITLGAVIVYGQRRPLGHQETPDKPSTGQPEAGTDA
jgi:hypothetical protein